MSTLITLLDENFDANDVNIMVFEPCIVFPPWPRDKTHGPFDFLDSTIFKFNSFEASLNSTYCRVVIKNNTTTLLKLMRKFQKLKFLLFF